MTELAVGDLLEGRYRVDRHIARGGMSTVYRCVDTRLGRAVAVKVMHDSLLDDPVFRRRFEREARAMAQLSHPNLVAVYDFSADRSQMFLVMELITGGTLRELLAERGPMPVHAAAAVLTPMLTGLAAAHSRSLIHRDIKPDNVLLGGDHTVKLADFGLVRTAEGTASATETSTTQVIGTVSYLSPEQVSGHALSPATDVYSAGVLAFELLTGTTPFGGETDIQRAMARLTDDVPAPSELADGIPPQFDSLVAEATRRNPAERFADAGEFLDAVVDISRELRLPPYTVPLPHDGAASRAAAVPTGATELFAPTGVLEQPPPARGGDGGVDETALLPADAEPSPLDEAPSSVDRTPGTAEVDPVFSPRITPVTNRSPLATVAYIVVVTALLISVAVGAWWLGSGYYGGSPSLFT